MENNNINKSIIELLLSVGVAGDIALTVPPKPEMGDIAFGCFELAKKEKKNPSDCAKEIAEKVTGYRLQVIEKVAAMGPYVNFFLNGSEVAKEILKTIAKEKKKFGVHTLGGKKKVLVEFGCMNPMKAFHLGHLRNLVTGESVARILENAGYKVLRTNYQGDVGMHIAKTLWGGERVQSSEFGVRSFDDAKRLHLNERIAFLGKAYAMGAKAYEDDETAKAEILTYNEIVYGERRDARVLKIYKKARAWSLDYFEEIYKKLGTRYDYYYFESEMTRRAIELVKEAVKSGALRQSQGAVIFEGSKYGLHERVFLNQKGYPTYEAKEVALAERHFSKHRPDRVIHVVGKEQTEYFKVLFKALEILLPETASKEFHLVGGYLQLKGDVKMSSRTGNVITGDELMELVGKRVQEIMDASGSKASENAKRKIANAALKYAMLRTGVSDDMAFDMDTSVSTSGDSGPYLLYIVARIKSILRKSKIKNLPAGRQGLKSKITITHVDPAEKQLLLKLAEFPEVTQKAAQRLDPSEVAGYVFGLAQAFNTFYHACPVLQAEEDVKRFRLRLIAAVEAVMTRGLYLLGIATVDEM